MQNANDGTKLNKNQIRRLKRNRKNEALRVLTAANNEDRLQHMKETMPSSLDSDTDSSTDEPCSITKRTKYDSDRDCSSDENGSDQDVPVTIPLLTANRAKNVTLLDAFLRSAEDVRAAVDRKKNILTHPKLTLLQRGFDAKPNMDGSPCSQPLLALDIFSFLMKLVNPIYEQIRRAKFYLWYRIDKPSKIDGVVLLIAQGISAKDFQNNVGLMPRTKNIFQTMVEVKPNKNRNIVESILSLACASAKSADSELGTDSLPNVKTPLEKEKCERTKLLLSLKQMIAERYPLFEECQSGYVCTKSEYAQVTNSSPIFGIDCEMCYTCKGNELTRVAVVDENLKLVYDELVKPPNKILDYLTRYSGITPQLLAGVSTSLEDVQNKIRDLLPSDAILCGHSLNCDLHALKMAHPYNIDTSVVFRKTAGRRHKSSLKYFTKCFLNRDIQVGLKGHNPIEDGSATLQLVQLKLMNGIEFGDAALSGEFEDRDEDKHTHEMNVYKRLKGFLHSTQKKVKIVTTDSTMTEASSESGTTSVVSQDKEVVEQTCQAIGRHDIAVAHIIVRPSDQESLVSNTAFTNLDKRIKKIYEACPATSMFMVLFDNSRAMYLATKENSLFFATVKPPS